MQIELSAEQIALATTVLGSAVGYLARTKADVIILQRDLKTAFKKLDTIEDKLRTGIGPSAVCKTPEEESEKEI